MIYSPAETFTDDGKNSKLPDNNHNQPPRTPKYPGLFKRIRRALGARNQAEVAAILGVSPSTVSGWKAQGMVSVDMLVKIALHSKASINWLLTGRGPQAVSPLAGNGNRVSVEAFALLQTRLLKIEMILRQQSPRGVTGVEAFAAVSGVVASSPLSKPSPDDEASVAETAGQATEQSARPAARFIDLRTLVKEFACDPELIFAAKAICDLLDQGIGDLDLLVRLVKRLRGDQLTPTPESGTPTKDSTPATSVE